MLKEASILRLARLIRFARMTRLIRLVKFLPEVQIMFKGILIAGRSVIVTFFLMLILTFVFAVLLRQVTNGTALGKNEFPSVLGTAYILLLLGALPEHADLIHFLNKTSWLAGLVTLLFAACSTIVLMNMLMGIIVQVMQVVGAMENEAATTHKVKTKITEILRNMDKDSNDKLSEEEFQALLTTPETAIVIKDLGVDPVGLVDFADFIYRDQSEISFPEFLDLLIQLRGANQATVKDIVDLRQFVTQELRKTEERYNEYLAMLLNSISMKPDNDNDYDEVVLE